MHVWCCGTCRLLLFEWGSLSSYSNLLQAGGHNLGLDLLSMSSWVNSGRRCHAGDIDVLGAYIAPPIISYIIFWNKSNSDWHKTMFSEWERCVKWRSSTLDVQQFAANCCTRESTFLGSEELITASVETSALQFLSVSSFSVIIPGWCVYDGVVHGSSALKRPPQSE